MAKPRPHSKKASRNNSTPVQRNGFPYSEALVRLTLETHLPTKWLSLDMETGDIWAGQLDGI